MSFFSSFLSIFEDKKCRLCRQFGEKICHSCQSEFLDFPEICYVCKQYSKNYIIHPDCRLSFPLTQVMVLYHYHTRGMKKLLHAGKFYGYWDIYEVLLEKRRTTLEKHIERTSSFFIPLPMHFFRKWKRGYNQTEKISFFLSKMLSLPVKNILSRKKYSRQQSHLSRSERLKNLNNVFAVSKNENTVQNPVYLVDDIISTGTTLKKAAEALQNAGYTDIRWIIIASD